MSEVSNLKLKLNALDKDRMDFDRFRDSEVSEQHVLRTHTHKYIVPFVCMWASDQGSAVFWRKWGLERPETSFVISVKCNNNAANNFKAYQCRFDLNLKVWNDELRAALLPLTHHWSVVLNTLLWEAVIILWQEKVCPLPLVPGLRESETSSLCLLTSGRFELMHKQDWILGKLSNTSCCYWSSEDLFHTTGTKKLMSAFRLAAHNSLASSRRLPLMLGFCSVSAKKFTPCER